MLSVTTSRNSAEFPIGKIEGIGMEVKRGSRIITHEDLSIYAHSGVIESVGQDKIKVTILARMQLKPGMPIKDDERVDTYKIEWTSDKEGKLINTSSKYKYDTTTFKIDGDELEIVSWIARNQLTETHVYRLVN